MSSIYSMIQFFHGRKLTAGNVPHGIGAFLKSKCKHVSKHIFQWNGIGLKRTKLTYPGISGRMNAFGDCACILSELSQIKRAILVFLISVNCSGVKAPGFTSGECS